MAKKTTKQKMGPLGNPLGNPLGFFNSQKVKRAAEPKQVLKKAQNGMTSGPMDANAAKYMDTKYPGTALKFNGPYSNDYMDAQRNKVARTHGASSWGSSADLEQSLRNEEEKQLRSKGWREDFNNGPLKTAEDIEEAQYRKGGAVKKKSVIKKVKKK
jgi:hypothetical protein